MEIPISTVAIIAIVLMIGLMAVPVIDYILQEALAKGCRTSQAVNKSKGRCIQE
ncbi:MAG TPA: hypothetical protein VF220_08580 [Nitrososphaeraceae archaeon]